MSGIFELRVDGPDRQHYRLFCLLDSKADGAQKPYLVVIHGLDKKFKTKFSPSQYGDIRQLADEYLGANPRSLYSN
jgi:hypothetical protein